MPDPPVLSNDPATTTDTVIRITWPEPFYGGIVIDSYSVFYDQGTGIYVELVNGYTNLYY